jgi:hypothetical protein
MEAAGSPYQQYIRWLPASQNKGAGQYWNGLCGNYDKETKTEGGPIDASTCTEIISTIFTVDAMVMNFDKVYGDILEDNPCLPIPLTDDPGFALLTYDPWYEDDDNDTHSPEDYKKSPWKNLISSAGQTVPRNEPAKRWGEGGINTARVLDLLTNLPSSGYIPTLPVDFDPKNLVVDEGNSSRRATPEELFESLGLIKCTSPTCEEERRALGQFTSPTLSTTELAEATPTSIFPVDTLAPLPQPIETGSFHHYHHTLCGH